MQNEQDYGPQAMVDRALVALSYYEALGRDNGDRAMFEQEYDPKYLVSSMMALVGLMINMSGINILEQNPGLGSDEVERVTIQQLREALVKLGQAIG